MVAAVLPAHGPPQHECAGSDRRARRSTASTGHPASGRASRGPGRLVLEGHYDDAVLHELTRRGHKAEKGDDWTEGRLSGARVDRTARCSPAPIRAACRATPSDADRPSPSPSALKARRPPIKSGAGSLLQAGEVKQGVRSRWEWTRRRWRCDRPCSRNAHGARPGSCLQSGCTDGRVTRAPGRRRERAGALPEPAGGWCGGRATGALCGGRGASPDVCCFCNERMVACVMRATLVALARRRAVWRAWRATCFTPGPVPTASGCDIRLSDRT